MVAKYHFIDSSLITNCLISRSSEHGWRRTYQYCCGCKFGKALFDDSNQAIGTLKSPKVMKQTHTVTVSSFVTGECCLVAHLQLHLIHFSQYVILQTFEVRYIMAYRQKYCAGKFYVVLALLSSWKIVSRVSKRATFTLAFQSHLWWT